MNGKYKVTATMKAIAISVEEDKEILDFFERGKAIETCEPGCGLGQLPPFGRNPNTVSIDPDDPGPKWFNDKNRIVDEVEVWARTTWACCGGRNFQATVFSHGNALYWTSEGGVSNEPIEF